MPIMLMLAFLLLPAADLLMLDATPLGLGIPSGWQVRKVRGKPAPTYSIRDEAEQRSLRIEGTGSAAWLYHVLRAPRRESVPLAWSWRVLQAPVGADLTLKRHDDSPIRIFVVFGRLEDLGGSSRAIFYTWGSDEAEGFAGMSHVSDRIAIVRLAGTADADGKWHDATVEPFSDYARFWSGRPLPLTTVGFMQDTDHTGEAAVAEVRQLSIGSTTSEGETP